jgi:hypothetical protein
MRRGIALIWLGATALVSAVVGVISYQAGWAAGILAHVPAGTVAPYPYYYEPHFFGFFGFLPFLFLVLIVLFLFRRGRWGRWGGYNRFGGPTPQQPPAGEPWPQEWPQRPREEEGQKQA